MFVTGIVMLFEVLLFIFSSACKIIYFYDSDKEKHIIIFFKKEKREKDDTDYALKLLNF